MTHFKIIGWMWLVFGALGFICACWQLAEFADLIFLSGGRYVLIPMGLECAFTFAGSLAGFGPLRHWRWARIAVEVLATTLFTCSVIAFLFGDFIASYAAFAAFASYSLVVALFVRYEPPFSFTIEVRQNG